MWSTLQTVILLTLLVELIAKSLPASSIEDLSQPIMAPPLDYLNEELDNLKNLIKSRAPSVNSIHTLNITIEAKRKLLKQYREKLMQLNELDVDRVPEPIHQREFHSYIATPGSQPAGVFKFPVNIAQPQDHRKEISVQSATLKLHRRPNVSELEAEKDRLNSTRRNVGHNTVILVYQTLPDNMRRLVTSSVISLANTGPISVDITEIAQNWLDEPAMNYGIEVECTSLNISHILLPAASTPIDIDTTPQPSIEIYTYESEISTSRRSRRDVTEDDICEPGKCCRQAVNITLADVGHHIEGFHEEGAFMTAYLCSGRCPRNYKLHNKWSSVKNIIRNRDRDTELRNRCAPTSYEKSYSLFSFDMETYSLTFTEYDDLIVKTCGCV